MVALTETLHTAAFMVSEASGFRSRGVLTIGLEQTILPGTVLAARAIVASVVAASAAAAGNTGNGALTLAGTPVSAAVKNGVYRATCIEPASNAGKFQVEDPNGVVIGIATVAVAFEGEVAFTIADGATDFVAGDSFTITVTVEAGDVEYVALNFAGTDGSQIAAAVAWDKITTDDTTRGNLTGIVRDAEVRASDLTWPAGANAAQIAAATQQLAQRGIIAR